MGIVVLVVVLLGFIAAIGAIVYFVIWARSGEAVSIPLRLLLRAYLYLISIASIVILVIGLSALIQAGLSAALGQEFSYNPTYFRVIDEPRPRPIAPGEEFAEDTLQSPEERKAAREEGLDRAFKEGVLNGLSFTLVGAVVLGLHVWSRRRMESEEERAGTFNRVYLILLLVIFSIVALILLPSAIYDTLRYYILESGDEFSRVRPGDGLAGAIVTVPVWAYYLSATLRALRHQEAETPATVPSDGV